VMVLPHDRDIEGFDLLIRFRDGKMTVDALRPTAPADQDEEEAVALEPVERRVAGVSA
jgi:hypothetical protein